MICFYFISRNFEFLIPDAPEVVANFLEAEQDMACRRNAFLMLLQVEQKRALEYLSACLDQIGTFGDILQLVIVELIYKVCAYIIYLLKKSELIFFLKGLPPQSQRAYKIHPVHLQSSKF
jgi:vesicle coat complex subunit